MHKNVRIKKIIIFFLDIPIVHISEPDTSIISSDLSIISTTDSGCEKVTQILQEWVRLHGPTIPMVNDLLHRLDEVHPGLPADYRSLMGTAQKLTIKTVEPGFYYHFGVCSGINYLTTKVVSLCQLESFNLHIFIDGAKVYKSSNVTIWPIFGRLRQLIECPFVIGIYCGCKKPSSANDFLADCISELIVLISEGFTLGNAESDDLQFVQPNTINFDSLSTSLQYNASSQVHNTSSDMTLLLAAVNRIESKFIISKIVLKFLLNNMTHHLYRCTACFIPKGVQPREKG